MCMCGFDNNLPQFLVYSKAITTTNSKHQAHFHKVFAFVGQIFEDLFDVKLCPDSANF